MGSSAKKKKDKKKDFQKPKLKVGKARPKPTNFTDTSFKAKSIVLNQQSLNTNAPSTSSQFSHHVSLLSSRSDSQRRESLSYLTSIIGQTSASKSLPQPVAVLLPRLLPLTLDGNNGVRAQLVKLLRNLPPEDIRDHMEKISLYLRAGLTHLAADIRYTALELLEWALDIGGEALVSCPAGWMKSLRTLFSVLAWNEDATISTWTSSRAIVGRSGDKSLPKTLNVLARLLRAGMIPAPAQDPPPKRFGFPLWHTDSHMLPDKSNAYGYLNLFGPPKDEDSQGYEDIEERRRVFRRVFEDRVAKGAAAARREGGEVGRAAAAITKALGEGLKEAK